MGHDRRNTLSDTLRNWRRWTKGAGNDRASEPGDSGSFSGLLDIRDLMSRAEQRPDTDDSITLSGLSSAARAIGPPVLLAPRVPGQNAGLKVGVAAIVVAAVVLVGAAAALLVSRSNSGGAGGGDVGQALALMSAELDGISSDSNRAVEPPAALPSSPARAVEPGDEPAQAAAEPQRARPRKSASAKHAEPAPPTASKAGSELDDLLGATAVAGDERKPRKQKKAVAPADVETALPKSLTRAQVQSGLKRVAPKVKRCGKQASGILTMRVVIGRNGRVSKALPTGALAGSKTGKCAARAVRKARFPRFSGSRITVTYPFRL